MSQDAHTPYLEMNILRRRYLKHKNNGRGGQREDVYEDMMLKYKYGFLKKRLEYLTIRKRVEFEDRLRLVSPGLFLSDEEEQLVKNKLNNNPELIQLKRSVKILKIQLLKKGYKPIYL